MSGTVNQYIRESGKSLRLGALAGEKMIDWISIEEELPEHGDYLGAFWLEDKQIYIICSMYVFPIDKDKNLFSIQRSQLWWCNGQLPIHYFSGGELKKLAEKFVRSNTVNFGKGHFLMDRLNTEILTHWAKINLPNSG